jgi:hypothetical protein
MWPILGRPGWGAVAFATGGHSCSALTHALPALRPFIAQGQLLAPFPTAVPDAETPLFFELAFVGKGAGWLDLGRPAWAGCGDPNAHRIRTPERKQISWASALYTP